MSANNSMVISMRLPVKSGQRLRRMASSHGWTPSDASARLVEEGLRRSEFAFVDFRDSATGRQACIQGSSLAVWEIMLLARGYKQDAAMVAKHLRWPEAKVQAAFNYASAFPDEINHAIADNDAVDFVALSQMLPQAQEFAPGEPAPKNKAVLKLLLDEQISPDVAEGFRRRQRRAVLWSLAEWEDGRFMGLPDDLLLAEAAAQKLTLVTYDRKTVPPLLKTWAEAGRDHGGIVFVDDKTIPSSDFGGLIRALQALFQEAAKWDWKNRICFLRR